jgi:hypothetical protein
MASEDTKRYSRGDIAAMKARREVRATPADAPEIELGEAFWEKARVVETTPATQVIGASSARLRHPGFFPLCRSRPSDTYGERPESLCRDSVSIEAPLGLWIGLTERGRSTRDVDMCLI